MNNDHQVAKWLRQLQQNSWEPEIFLSGIIVFSLFQIPEYMEEYRQYIHREIDVGSNYDLVFSIFYVGIYWLIFGFIFHLFTRGVWGSLIGLSFVFPEGIKKDKLNYKGKFAERLKKMPTLEEKINQLEILSSSIFSITFLLFMSMVAFMIWFMVMLLVMVILVYGFKLNPLAAGQNVIVFSVMYIYLLLGIIYLIDFVTLGLFKRIKWLARIFYPLHWVYSKMALSALYTHVYYTYISNFKRWKIITVISIYMMISLAAVVWKLIDVSRNYGTQGLFYSRIELFSFDKGDFVNSVHYEDQKPDDFHQATIQSEMIEGDLLRLFIIHRFAYEALHDDEGGCVFFSNEEDDDNQSKENKVACINTIYQVEIDGEPLGDIDWMFHVHPSAGQKGFLQWLDISHLEKGKHVLNITVDLKSNKVNYASIPFYKLSPASRLDSLTSDAK